MGISRRDLFIAACAAAITSVGFPAVASFQRVDDMYGLIGKMICVPGQRDAVLAILLEGTGGMPGCLSYVVARDPSNADAIWITEVWDNKASHDASLSLPAVRAAITRAKPLIAGFGESFTTTPVGGVGLPPAKAE
jgi:quinol monooxygenase YgiN